MACSCRNKSGSVVGESDEPYAPVWMERTRCHLLGSSEVSVGCTL